MISTSVHPGSSKGHRLCLDFVNLPFLSGEITNRTLSWPLLVNFLAAKQIISSEKAEQLESLPESDAYAAETLLRQAQALREGLLHLFEALLQGQRVHREWTEPVNRILRVTEGHDELEWNGSSWRLGFVAREEGLEWLLAAIARSGAELVADGHSRNLRQCANPNCRILFYDDSRTHRRRWCSMTVCGNRSKVAAFARRHSGERARAHHA